MSQNIPADGGQKSAQQPSDPRAFGRALGHLIHVPPKPPTRQLNDLLDEDFDDEG